MAEITTSMVKELRERTQAGMGDCKSALVEAGGDIDKAVEVILKKGIVKAASRAGKVATEGEVRAVVNGKTGVLVEVNCQTDFVSRGDDFRAFVTKVCDAAKTAKKGTDLNTLEMRGATNSSQNAVRTLSFVVGMHSRRRRQTALSTRTFTWAASSVF